MSPPWTRTWNTNALVHDFPSVKVNDVLSVSSGWWTWYQKSPTLIMIANVDRNNDGFTAGSRTFVEDWKLWMGVKRYRIHGSLNIPWRSSQYHETEQSYYGRGPWAKAVNPKGAEQIKWTYKIGNGGIEEDEKSICKQVKIVAFIISSKAVLTFLGTSFDRVHSYENMRKTFKKGRKWGLTFEIHGHHQGILRRCYWQPNPFHASHCWSSKRGIDKVIQGVALPNRLIPCR